MTNPDYPNVDDIVALFESSDLTEYEKPNCVLLHLDFILSSIKVAASKGAPYLVMHEYKRIDDIHYAVFKEEPKTFHCAVLVKELQLLGFNAETWHTNAGDSSIFYNFIIISGWDSREKTSSFNRNTIKIQGD